MALFEQALKLPGDDYDVRRVSAQNSPVGGAPVLRDLERVTFPSVLQRQTAHYNIACCRAKLGQSVEALDALETALSLGFDDFQLVQREGDFSAIEATSTGWWRGSSPRASSRTCPSRSRAARRAGWTRPTRRRSSASGCPRCRTRLVVRRRSSPRRRCRACRRSGPLRRADGRHQEGHRPARRHRRPEGRRPEEAAR